MFGLNKNKPAEKAEINEMSDLETEILRSYKTNPGVWSHLPPEEGGERYTISHGPSMTRFVAKMVRYYPPGNARLVDSETGVEIPLRVSLVFGGKCNPDRVVEFTAGEVKFGEAFAKAMHALYAERFNRKADEETAEKKSRMERHLREAFGLVPRTGGAP